MRDYDIESDLKQEKFQTLKLVQGDKGNKIKINVFEDGQPVNLTGCSITAKYKRSDGEVVDGTVTNISNNSFDAVMDSDITKASGTLKMLFRIEKDDVKVSTFMLLADVREGIGESTGSSGGSTGGGEVTIDLSDYYKKSETYSKAQIDSQFKDIANLIESGNIGNNVEPQLMDMPRIYFSEGTLPTTKTATTLRFDYYSKTAEYHGWAEIKCQGNSSMAYNKKNFTIKLYKDKEKTEKLKINFKGWGKQSKFVLKANWIDITHARNVVSARIWGDIVKSRSDYDTLPELLRTSPNQGAIDGFPITVYGNGYYQGRYTLNIPKDKWMTNMDDTLDIHCILCGEDYNSGCFRALPTISGTDWTDEIHDTVPDTIKLSWRNAINFVMTSNDEEFKSNLNNYIDVESAIDYLLYGIISTGLDAFGKNQIYFTYDGLKWIASMYDMDSTWGLYWDGSKILSNTYSREQFEDMINSRQGNLLYIRLQQLFITEIKARYVELRKTIFTYPYLVNKFEEFIQICPNDIVKEDYAKTTANGAYTGIPSTTTNNIQQIRDNINARLEYMDSYINGLIESVSCTNITLDKTTLSFTTADTQTLTPTVTPVDTTDSIIWSVNPTGICTVDNGVVTPIRNGNCVITATCGSQTATCNVTVSGITTKYTITNNLTNCTNSNTATTIEENSSYTATITASDGYTLGNVTVTMGGTDISSTAVSNGVITINSVTGDLVITATATKIIDGTTNLLDGVNSTIVGNNLQFDSITLQPGLYDFKNINGGTFTYLGGTIDNYGLEPGNTTTTGMRILINKADTPVVIHAYPNNVESNTADKLGLYKVYDFTDTTNKVSFTKQGDGYFVKNDTSSIVENNLDTYGYANIDLTKKYRFNLKSELTTGEPSSMVCAIKDGFYFSLVKIKTGCGFILGCLDSSDDILKGYFTGADKVWWSGRNTISIDNIELIEIEVTEL